MRRSSRRTLSPGRRSWLAVLLLSVAPAASSADSEAIALPAASGRDELCLFSAGRFACDTAHDGGAAELVLRFGGRQREGVPLLGDLDGDGRDDPCFYRGFRFLCDTAHDGGTAEVKIRFGRSERGGDVPLMGDLDGDGRDDPCVFSYSAASILCDTAHDGGAAEARIPWPLLVFPLLGDVDGDGDSDPCVYDDLLRHFLCDPAHDGFGGADDLGATFGPRRSINVHNVPVPLLGDLDGDGDDDFCFQIGYRNGRLFCDLDHRGGEAEVLLPAPLAWPVTERLLLADPDGL